MINAKELWSQRFQAHIKETSRYLKYIFNGHIAIAMFFFISALAYYYQRWLMELPENFPTAWVVGIVFGLAASYSPVRTLLKEPDLVFLLPAEHQLKDYFKRCLGYSFVIQLYLIFLVVAALGPLYFESYPELGMSHYLYMLVGLLVVKALNMFANWWMLKERNPTIRLTDQAIRTLLTICLFFFFAENELLFVGIVTLILVVLVIYIFQYSSKKAGLVFDLLVLKDRARMRTFYRIANMFTDVPHLRNTVKKRHALVRLLTASIHYRQNETFTYLYRITFIRSSDYLGMYFRLIGIGGLAVWFVPNLWVKIAFAILFLYLSAFQMMSLWNHHRIIVWLDLYPVKKEWKQQAMLTFLKQLMLFQTILFTLLFLIQWNLSGVLIVAAGGTLFTYIFIQSYVKPRLM
ncbi:ABC transporter permease [Halobacillus andaensis]|uniref:ABC transporter permease n=1 Tax=Halobacillus andaensis TaxID=1176239 RepID=A0A917B3E2_HALAA|nr:ABC transporter permease [Halobacillus andaensis]MBP2004122.1 ABC-2 type transport system permease protein [Halobacillus andaensis]GGF15958.1 ABC transporter permease [Halobacillus andaensis]